MQRTMGDTWWTEMRWRVALQFLLWGLKIAPAGDARGYLIDLHREWIEECSRQWRLRYGEIWHREPGGEAVTDDNERILMQLRGVPAKTMTKLEAMMDPANPQAFEANDNDRRIAELEAENRRMREALDAFWRGSLVIESSVRRTEGKGSPVYQNVLAAILKAQEFYKNLPKAARAALSQEEKP